MIRFFLLFFVIQFYLVGCAAPKYYSESASIPKIDFEDRLVPIQVEKIREYIVIRDDLAEMGSVHRVDVQFSQSVSVRDFFLSLGNCDVNFVVEVAKDRMITVPRWNGSLRSLLQALQRSSGLFFYRVSDRSYVVRESAVCALRMIYQGQSEKMVDLLKNAFSARSVVVDDVSGTVVFEANSWQYLEIVSYLRKVPVQFVELDLAFLETELTSERKFGIDFTKIAASIRDLSSKPTSLAITVDNGFSVSLAGGSVSLSAVINSLESYDQFSILQRFMVSGISGKSFRLDVSEKIPYVSKVVSTAGQNGPAVRGYEFSEESSGLVVDVFPVADRETVAVNTDISYRQVFTYVKVGSGDDMVSRPVTAVRSIKGIVMMRPGAVQKLATMRYTKKIRNQQGLRYLSGSLRGDMDRDVELTVLGRVVLKRYVFD